jgi:hypothetical protein
MSDNHKFLTNARICPNCSFLFAAKCSCEKYCDDCKKIIYEESKKEWRAKNGKQYMREYMKKYRRINPLATIIFILISFMNAEAGWFDTKKNLGISDYTGSISFIGTYLEPPPYELSFKADNSTIILNKFSLTRKGWMPYHDEEESDYITEPREAGRWSLDYGRTGTTPETTFLESDSVYGWRLQLGEISEILWGRNSYGDRIATASFNTERFSFSVTKSFGSSQSELDYEFISSDYLDNPSANFLKARPRDITKYEGGDFRIPFSWREVNGEAEIAARKFFDPETSEDKKGLAYSLNAAAPRFIFSCRQIEEGFESSVRTTDASLKIIPYKTDPLTVTTGYRILNFSGDTDTRHSFTSGVIGKIRQITINADGEFYQQGTDRSAQFTGGILGQILNTSLALRRTENITGLSISESNSLSISRKQGSVTLSYGKSEYTTTEANNYNITANLNLTDELKIGFGGIKSISKTVTTITTQTRSNGSCSFRNTTFNTFISPTSETYTIARDFNINDWGFGNRLSVGATYQRFIGGEGLTGNLSFTW